MSEEKSQSLKPNTRHMTQNTKNPNHKTPEPQNTRTTKRTGGATDRITRNNAEKNNTCAQLYAFAVTAMRDCLQAVDTSFCVEPNADNLAWL